MQANETRPAPPRAFLLDFDGVVVDSAGLKTAAFAEIYRTDAPDKLTEIVAYQQHQGGMSRRLKFEYFERTLLARTASESDIDALCRRFADLVVAQVVAAPLMPGAEAFLDAAGGASDLFLISGTPEDELLAILAARRMSRRFLGVYGAPTTKLEAFRDILGSRNYAAGDTVAVGDAVTEQDAALALGIPFIGIRSPTHDAGFRPGLQQADDLAEIGRLYGLML